MEFIEEYVVQSDTAVETSTQQQLETEVSQYMGEEATSQSPLDWWRTNKRRYPLLSQVAAKYLASPATSVPCERVFSIAGHIVTEKQACLLPQDVNMLVFLTENLD